MIYLAKWTNKSPFKYDAYNIYLWNIHSENIFQMLSESYTLIFSSLYYIFIIKMTNMKRKLGNICKLLSKEITQMQKYDVRK